ncbi:MAG: hypothetical protein PUD16_03525 [bacterium]|nr:hypothetical protein [bacterium]
MWKPWKSGFSPYGASKTPLENLWKSGGFFHRFSTYPFTLTPSKGARTDRISPLKRPFPAQNGENHSTKRTKKHFKNEFSTFSTPCGKRPMENQTGVLQGFPPELHIFSTPFSTKKEEKTTPIFDHFHDQKRWDS